ncbi:2-oxoacid:acceptor oxidoreductase family protein [Desulfovibrio sp. OttesenSCG-928-C06]|nr:2-oxoacid:acceptor oxidoreductase family protein [Desulfovibrio sp. OttesenSCG-928-C06]
MKQIKIFGLGGQGVVTAAKVFAKAVALGEGRNALSIPAYGHERRGAPVYSDLILDDEPIKLRSFVYEPDVVIIFDLSVLDKGVDVMKGASSDTLFIVNAESLPAHLPFAGHPVRFVDAEKISLEELGRYIPNTTMLGAAAGAGLCGLEAMNEAIRTGFGAAWEANVKSAGRGYHELRGR